jgi:hypothetical protein
MNIREISDVFKDTASDIEALKSYNFGWASDRVRQGNTEDFQELNAFPRVFFSVPTITASDQIRKQDTYQVTLFFDDLLGYDNEGDADLTLQIDKWAALQNYATAFIQRLNLIKQSILPNYLFIPEPPQFTFDSFVGIQRLVTVQVNFNLVVPTNCEVTVKRIIELVGNAIATGTSQANIFLSTSVSAFVECKATATGFIVTGQQNIIEVDASVTAFALASGDIVRVQNVSATTIATATAQAEVQRAVNIIGELNATGQVSGNINLTLFATGSADARATVNANLEVTTQGVVECEANVTGTSVTSGSLFVIRTLEAQSVAEATSQSQIILSKLLSGVASGFAVAEGNIQRVISVDSSIDTTVTTSAEAQITIPVTAQATAIAETTSEAQIIRIISAEATATAESSAEANFGITFNAGIEATANVVNADLFRTATLEASVSGAATVTSANLTNTPSVDADATAFFLRVTTAGGSLTSTEQSAVDTLVKSLKANGVWTKMKAIYPMVGASAAACAQNLKSSSFTGTFTAGWTFASSGATPNGTSAYMDTGLIPNTSLSQNNASIGYYGGTTGTSLGCAIGSGDGTSYLQIFPAYPSQGLFGDVNDASIVITANTNAAGFIFASRLLSTSKIHSIRSTISTLTNNSNGLNNIQIVLGARRVSAVVQNYSALQHRLSFIGDGLTNTEAADYYTAVQAFQTTLSRAIV